jgi:hypothetical protein
MAPSLQGDNTLYLKSDIFVDLVRELENLLGEGEIGAFGLINLL